jgi:hypothetical protein
MHGTLKTLRTPRTEGTETQWSSSLPTRLPRARRALADDAVVTWDGPYPYGQRQSQRRQSVPGCLTGCATSVPFTAVLGGPERITTDNTEAVSTCADSHLCR